MGPNGTVTVPPTQDTQVNLDKIFLEDFRVAFSVSLMIRSPWGNTKII